MDDISEIPQEIQENQGVLSEIVTDEEYRLLEDYYIYDEDISKLADARKISVSAMYQRIYRIKKKILNNSDKLNNMLEK